MSDEVIITKGDVIQNFARNSVAEDVNAGVDFVLGKLGINRRRIAEASLMKLRQSVSSLHSKDKERWIRANRTRLRYSETNEKWLSSEFQIPDMEISDTSSSSSSSVVSGVMEQVPSQPLISTGRGRERQSLEETGIGSQPREVQDQQQPTSSMGRGRGRGRPKLPYEELGESSRRQDAIRITQQFPTTPTRLVSAAAYAARTAGRQDLAKILQVAQRSPHSLATARRVLFQAKKKEPRKYTPVEALSLILSNNLSKSQYIAISKGLAEHDFMMFPGYNRVAKEKLACRPAMDQLFIDDGKAEVLLQTLLDHTTDRIVKLQDNVISQFYSLYDSEAAEAELIVSWGCDGSSDHSIYKNKSTTPVNDASLFATTITPLRLQRTTAEGEVVIFWNNLTPQSPRFCRPVRLQFQPESQQLVLHEIAKMEAEIGTLQPCEVLVESTGKLLKVNFVVLLTMIDGKILNIKTNTSSQSCPICHAKPSQFNDLRNVNTEIFTPNPANLQHGISPLHAWIRMLECCLHISYRLAFNPPIWRVPGGKKNASLNLRKQHLQQQLQEALGIRVDYVKQGAGTTNDGNTARIAFRNYEKFAEILGLDVSLVKNFRTILIALSCQLPLDPLLFGELCKQTAELYVRLYNWYPMPATIHKILIHGSQILTHSILPVGMLGEDAQEARNKHYRKFRLDHARKTTRRDNMGDMFLRTMDTSDPILSSIDLQMRMNKRTRFPIPTQVLELLAKTEEPSRITEEPEPEDDEEDEEEDDSDSNADFSGLSDVDKLLQELELQEEEEISVENE